MSIVTPHHCCGCDKIGSLLCPNCKNNITSDLELFCIVCGCPTINYALCKTCRMPFEKAWVVGKRKSVLQRLIGLYKFQRARDGYKVLGDLLLSALPELPVDTVIVPIPTTSSHIRERGYDHMLLIARYIAHKRGLNLRRVLIRKTATKQRQADATTRVKQAKAAFEISGAIDSDVPYLIIDDVVTTGATIKYAAKTLRDAGAKHVWVAAIARQTLD